jgi:hypothetical protein
MSPATLVGATRRREWIKELDDPALSVGRVARDARRLECSRIHPNAMVGFLIAYHRIVRCDNIEKGPVLLPGPEHRRHSIAAFDPFTRRVSEILALTASAMIPSLTAMASAQPDGVLILQLVMILPAISPCIRSLRSN